MSLPPPAIRRVGFADLTTRELYGLLRLRSAVFVVEQASAFPDIDGRDGDALHLIATNSSGAIVGCARCLPPESRDADAPVSFGRLAVDRSQRSSGLGRALVADSLAALAEYWPGRDVVISAQLYLERFYGGFGFERVSDIYDDFGIPHLDMRLRH